MLRRPERKSLPFAPTVGCMLFEQRDVPDRARQREERFRLCSNPCDGVGLRRVLLELRQRRVRDGIGDLAFVRRIAGKLLPELAHHRVQLVPGLWNRVDDSRELSYAWEPHREPGTP